MGGIQTRKVLLYNPSTGTYSTVEETSQFQYQDGGFCLQKTPAIVNQTANTQLQQSEFV